MSGAMRRINSTGAVMAEHGNITPKPPAQVSAYVEILGVDGAIEFLLEFGGAELYMAKNPKTRNRLADFVGKEKAILLAKASDHLPKRIPLKKPWIAAVLRSKGLPVAQIARKLHMSDVAVRGWLKQAGVQPPKPAQGELPL